MLELVVVVILKVIVVGTRERMLNESGEVDRRQIRCGGVVYSSVHPFQS